MSSTEFLRTPQGLRHRSLFHAVGGDSRIRKEGGLSRAFTKSGELLSEVQSLPVTVGVAPVPADGWISYADWTNSTGNAISSFTTIWKVPPPPTATDAQTIFLFNSLLDSNQTHILQPVLQWGNSAAPGSGGSWGVASWWVGQPNDPCFITDLMPVNVGNTLIGSIQLQAVNGNLFDYTCEFVGIPSTRLTAQNLPELDVCTETLETYGVKTPSDYPATPSTSFTAINVRAGSIVPPLTWTAKGASLPLIVTNSANNGELSVQYPTS
jgi:hypothetical protein